MMPCISRKLCVDAKAFYYLMLIVLLNNLQCSMSALSTTVPSTFGGNSSSHEPVCSNVKDIMLQRGIAEKDLPAKFPIKGKWQASMPTLRVKTEVKSSKDVFHVRRTQRNHFFPLNILVVLSSNIDSHQKVFLLKREEIFQLKSTFETLVWVSYVR